MVEFAYFPPEENKIFFADHPFLIALIYKDNLLFTGRLSNF